MATTFGVVFFMIPPIAPMLLWQLDIWYGTLKFQGMCLWLHSISFQPSLIFITLKMDFLMFWQFSPWLFWLLSPQREHKNVYAAEKRTK